MKIIVVVLLGILMFGCLQQEGQLQNNSTPEQNHSIPMPTQISNEMIQGNDSVQMNDEKGIESNGTENATNDTITGTLNNTNGNVSEETTNFSTKYTDDGTPIVYYFYTPGCSACKTMESDMRRLENASGILILRYSLKEHDGHNAYLEFTRQYGLNNSQMFVPQMLFNGTISTGIFEVNDTINMLLGLNNSK